MGSKESEITHAACVIPAGLTYLPGSYNAMHTLGHLGISIQRLMGNMLIRFLKREKCMPTGTGRQ